MTTEEKQKILQERDCPWLYWGYRVIKRFQSLDPAEPHCYSRNELCKTFSELTDCTDAEAEKELPLLFAWQPGLTFSRHGIVCKKTFFPEVADIATQIFLDPDTISEYLPEEWYLSMQIPEDMIENAVWSCWKYTGIRPMPCTDAFAQQVIRNLKQRRGEFIRKYGMERLKFFWLEYGSFYLPERSGK